VITLLIVIGVVMYALARSTTSQASAGLTNAGDLNPAPSQFNVGTIAPDFTLRDSNGTSYSLAAQRGHPVLLEFFAVWCPICQGEAPIMAKLAKTYTPKGVRIWSILANPYGRNYEASGGTDLRLADKADLAWLARTFDVHYPQLIDPTFTVVNQYGINAYPGLYVIDKTGRVIFSSAGHHSYASLTAALDKALGGGRSR
jgi:cytochrome oxidase Cu insertion factor (SCO1/SenC/PrrC family)